MAALEQAAVGGKPELPGGFDGARAAFARLAEREQAQTRAATYAEARKNELVAYLAHDIKTPLTSVVGYLALLAEEPGLPAARRERYARSALEKAQRLDGMMDEFFEITRYNLGAIPIERETTDVALLVEQVADELYPAAMGRGVRIEVEAPEGLSAFIDPEKMARVMGNLLKNGIAYAKAGTAVVCRARVEEAAGDATAASEGGAAGDAIDAGGSNAAGGGSAAGDVAVEGTRLVLTVEDTGKEISAAHLDRIFDKFYREDGARSGKGAGLGLAIAREIVEAHGGAIDASSELGVTTFTVRVPA
ncbi:sensor histidine kinase [Enorma massiliensis]|uniref:sensor histidine kinase n=1 Tax=Enorma massiliensis TaxID=1472761 RepID=UPI003F5F57CB